MIINMSSVWRYWTLFFVKKETAQSYHRMFLSGNWYVLMCFYSSVWFAFESFLNLYGSIVYESSDQSAYATTVMLYKMTCRLVLNNYMIRCFRLSCPNVQRGRRCRLFCVMCFKENDTDSIAGSELEWNLDFKLKLLKSKSDDGWKKFNFKF